MLVRVDTLGFGPSQWVPGGEWHTCAALSLSSLYLSEILQNFESHYQLGKLGIDQYLPVDCGLQVPEDCPQAVSDLVFACLHQHAANRPDALQIIQILQSSIADNSQVDV